MQRPNYYTTHLIEKMRPLLPRFDAISKENAQRILDGYRHGTKFVLPSNGLLFDDVDALRYVDFFRLPFSKVVLEYEGVTSAWGRYKNKYDPSSPGWGLEGVPAGSVVRVALYAEEAVGPRQAGSNAGKEGINIALAYNYPSSGVDAWFLFPIVVFVPRGLNAKTIETERPQFNTFPIMTEMYSLSGLQKVGDEQIAEFGRVIVKEAISLFQFCAACECSNVRSTEIKAPKFINKKREAKGELPLFEYRVLTVDVTERDERGDPKGGTHAGPREHLRRGHIRRFKSGHIPIWINSMTVGHRELGRVKKDYRVTRPRAAG